MRVGISHTGGKFIGSWFQMDTHFKARRHTDYRKKDTSLCHYKVRGVSAYSLKRLDPFEHLPVLLQAQVVIGTTKVPRVEGVVTDHVEGLLRETVLVATEHPVQVLIMTPGDHHLLQTAVLSVHAKTSAAQDTERRNLL